MSTFDFACPTTHKGILGNGNHKYEFTVCSNPAIKFESEVGYFIPTNELGCSADMIHCIPYMVANPAEDSGEPGDLPGQIHKKEVVADDGNKYNLILQSVDFASGEESLVPFAQKVDRKGLRMARKCVIQKDSGGRKFIQDRLIRYYLPMKN